MKFNNPLPQPLPKECQKAAKIFQSFVDSANHGLDGIIPRSVLEDARGFAIFTVFKAGFVVSARGGSGVVIARLDDGSWSAPSAIGTAGMGFGGQLGAEVTDFLLILNSRAAVRQFMSAGSVTLGGNMSVAIGPLGRNGEATGAVNTQGKVAAMYSYSKTKGLFGGVSLEGSIIVERQDANALAYDADVTAKMLLSGALPPPAWAGVLVNTLERCTGLPGGRTWVTDNPLLTPELGSGYAFGGSGSPGSKGAKPKSSSNGWSPFSSRKRDSYFSPDPITDSPPPSPVQASAPTKFDTPFESDAAPNSRRSSGIFSSSPFQFRSAPPPSASKRSSTLVDIDDFDPLSTSRSSMDHSTSDPYSSSSASQNGGETSPTSARPFLQARAGLMEPLAASEVGRAIALHDFDAVEQGDLSFNKGDVIAILRKTDRTNDWWRGRVGRREGNFPANYVEVLQ
ncbi:DUF500-domain-containing protein [Exidia glandulosa HHB12029]|uniref:DUF500-domain-containing protein n=1 Tax=Exidia glandulosa HHB12029 TaxID=1314781 RepID=A0A165PEX9_EXIGL|nr:DUF500-domain-containing protein [Exidia glandulosa HHB12029]